MNLHQTKGGHAFQCAHQEIPGKDGTPMRWYDVWATIGPKETEEETLLFCWELVLEMARWLKLEHLNQNFRIIVGWDKSVREHQGQIFKIFEAAKELDFVLACATAAEYRSARPGSLAPLPGWQKDVFKNQNGA